ncbi:Lysine-specific demethylase 7A [Gamsiella multidivaricata]|nr:Lysine-specific demethylase 7A [Gamsiella multidivaricata]
MKSESSDRCALCPKRRRAVTSTSIICEACQKWFHIDCLGITIEETENINEYHCAYCVDFVGPSTFKRTTRSKALDASGTRNSIGTAAAAHNKWKSILDSRKFQNEDFPRVSGKDITVQYLRETGFRTPILIKLDKDGTTKGLDMVMPKTSWTVSDVRDAVGANVVVNVIDVATQSEAEQWDMGSWAAYFNGTKRNRIYNVISLEVSNTPLSKHIRTPRIVSHVDFGGSSVFYHIISGSKIFLVAEPTPFNLEKYKEWCKENSASFLGDQIKCYKLELQQGDTLLIPAGWIHCVYTPVDSIVIGGNFVHSLHIPMQLQIARIEQVTNTPSKYRFPFFEKLCWFVVLGHYIMETDKFSALSNIELHGLLELTDYLFLRQQHLNSGLNVGSEKASIKKSVPPAAYKFRPGGQLELLRRLNSKLCSIITERGKTVNEKHRLLSPNDFLEAPPASAPKAKAKKAPGHEALSSTDVVQSSSWSNPDGKGLPRKTEEQGMEIVEPHTKRKPTETQLTAVSKRKKST